MKPHLMHIKNTLERKQKAEQAKDVNGALARYWTLIETIRARGYDDDAIIRELEAERFCIKTDKQYGDSLFLEGVKNAQEACIAAIDKIISELKGEN